MVDLIVTLRSLSIRKHSLHLLLWETRVSGTAAGGAKARKPQAGRDPKGSQARESWEVRAPSGCCEGNGFVEGPRDWKGEKPMWPGLRLLRGS